MSQAVVIRHEAPSTDGQPGRAWQGGVDPWLLTAFLGLLAFGLVMVSSASIGIAERNFGEPLHYVLRQSAAAVLGLGLAGLLLRTPLVELQRSSTAFLLLALVLGALVLVPGLGREVNGSLRWVRIGPLSLQASEPIKLLVILYLAGYLVRHGAQVRTAFLGFVKPILVLTLLAGLLLLEPDYGATVVLFATTLGMLFMGGVPIARFAAWGFVAVGLLAALAMLEPYRVARLTAFMDPWADPWRSGFQLTQALIAFGRGEWLGVGLGSSVQKLFYLPEVHTDFIFAVIAEELGLAGTLALIALYLFIVWRAFWLGALAERLGRPFSAYVAYGVGFLIGLQAFVNMGVNMGLLPTKGLTLPLVSYGSNSLVTTCAAFGLLLRVSLECAEPSRHPTAEAVHG